MKISRMICLILNILLIYKKKKSNTFLRKLPNNI